MNRLLLLCLAFTCGLPVVAQKNFKKAVVYTDAGDSINCYLMDKEWLQNPGSISIKKTLADKAEVLRSGITRINIAGGDHYVFTKVQVDITPSVFQTAFMDPALIKSEEQTAFLLVEYADSRFNLYSLRTGGRIHYYLQHDQGAIEELIYRKVSLARELRNFETEDKTFITQLQTAMTGCEKALSKCNGINYSWYDITRVLKTYDAQCGHATASYINTTKGKFNFVLLAGISLNKTTFETSNPFFYSDLITGHPLNAGPAFSAGAEINYVFPRWNQRASFLIDFTYNAYKVSKSSTDFTSNDFYTDKKLVIQPVLLRLNPALRYYFLRKPLRPFIQAGLEVVYSVYHSDRVEKHDHLNGTDTYSQSDPYAAISYNKLILGFAVGGGVDYKRLSLQYKYEPSTGFSDAAAIRSYLAAQSILLGFRLNK